VDADKLLLEAQKIDTTTMQAKSYAILNLSKYKLGNNEEAIDLRKADRTHFS
jgi:hypothetical protein